MLCQSLFILLVQSQSLITLSHSLAKASECDTARIAILRSFASIRKYFATSSADSESRAEVGSSASRSCLPVSPAMVSIIRWRCPPEISLTCLFHSELSSPSSAQSANMLSLENFMFRFTRSSKSDITICSTVSYGRDRSWGTYAVFCRIVSTVFSSRMSPSTSINPVDSAKPCMALSRDDFPHPDSPQRQTISPLLMFSEMLLNIFCES